MNTSDQHLTFPAQILAMETEFTVLSQPRRRYLLYTLAEDPEWNLRELATKIAAWELDLPEEAVPEADRDKVYVSLMHAHVPKLVDHDAVAFNHETEILSKSEFTDQILKSLNGFGGSTDSQQEGHAGREFNE